MNPKLITIVCAAALLPVAGFTQEPPNPPNPPNSPGTPPRPPGPPPERHEKKVPVTFLGVETSDVPNVVCEQLGLPKGFGLVVDYVVPNSPAATAGVQQSDIIKMLNDQILTEPEQLAKLVRNYSDGTNITLTVLRKGKEEKITVKLTKKEVPQHEIERGRRHRHSGFPFGDHDFGDFGLNELNEQMSELKESLGDEQRGMIHDAVMKARKQAERARVEAREQVRRAGDQLHVFSKDMDALKATRIDIGKAQIVFSDDKGELRIEKVDGKKMLTAKDPQSRLLFSGPVETDDDLAKVPADVRARYQKLQQNDLPGITQPGDTDEDDESIDAELDAEPLSADQISVEPAPPKMSILEI
jgi:hypothetical protein